MLENRRRDGDFVPRAKEPRRRRREAPGERRVALVGRVGDDGSALEARSKSGGGAAETSGPRPQRSRAAVGEASLDYDLESFDEHLARTRFAGSASVVRPWSAGSVSTARARIAFCEGTLDGRSRASRETSAKEATTRGGREVFVGRREVFVGRREVFVGRREVFVGRREVFVGRREVVVEGRLPDRGA